MTPDWPPDWKDALAYPAPEDISPPQWAWQFLRRNPDYQEDYEGWRDLLDSLGPEGKMPNYEEDMRFAEWDPPAPPGETYKDYRERLGDEPFRSTSLAHSLPQKYGFRGGGVWRAGDHRWATFGLPPPDRKIFDGWFETSVVRSLSGIPGRGPVQVMPTVDEFEIYVCFNLEWPLKVQLERARWKLELERAHHENEDGLGRIEKRNRFDKYPFYLRVLDGEAAGASAGEMAEILLPDMENDYPDRRATKTIVNGLVSAKRLRDGDYLYIPLAYGGGPPRASE